MERQVNAAGRVPRDALCGSRMRPPMPISLKPVFAWASHKHGARRLYGAIVDHARSPGFYEQLGVPDTVTGRYAMVALHVFVVMDRLGRADGQGKASQALVDVMVDDLDRNLREMGVGDLSVGKRVKALMGHFYAMAAACRDGLDRGDAVLGTVLSDFLYGGEAPPQSVLTAMTAYLRACVADLADQAGEDISDGRIHFPGPPQLQGR